jgi:hypothetical protein
MRSDEIPTKQVETGISITDYRCGRIKDLQSESDWVCRAGFWGAAILWDW